MFEKLIVIVFLFICFNASAQNDSVAGNEKSEIECNDIITFNNRSVVKAKVLEINDNNVLYKRCANLLGPTITVSKKNIMSIKYANGMLESIFQNKRLTETVVFKKEDSLAMTRIEQRSGIRLLYRKKNLYKDKLGSLITSYPNKQASGLMATDLKEMKIHQRNQKLFGFGFVAISIATFYATANSLTYNGSGPTYVFLPVGVSLGIASIMAMRSNGIKAHARCVTMVERYNVAASPNWDSSAFNKKLLFHDYRFISRVKDIKGGQLKSLILSHPDQDISKIMLTDYNKLQKHRNKQLIFGLLAPASFIAMAISIRTGIDYHGLFYGPVFTARTDDSPFIIIPATFAIGITSIIISSSQAHSCRKYKRSIAEIYNTKL